MAKDRWDPQTPPPTPTSAPLPPPWGNPPTPTHLHGAAGIQLAIGYQHGPRRDEGQRIGGVIALQQAWEPGARGGRGALSKGATVN